ncbi:hypothetical protein FDP41_008003 [Naegleria fowleri]|uniref:Uncharacterized protein n=1 Tax=Naegleria fowleri TaxID=5763 RepID=A0A6A5CFA9_NAEFO|nr:uncharacterized protein FDP41_008003 [Naegleria fowleri]KAF0984088.1 hypothetical protein FDP41_008003 [Naegleria fowleri]
MLKMNSSTITTAPSMRPTTTTTKKDQSNDNNNDQEDHSSTNSALFKEVIEMVVEFGATHSMDLFEYYGKERLGISIPLTLASMFEWCLFKSSNK